MLDTITDEQLLEDIKKAIKKFRNIVLFDYVKEYLKTKKLTEEQYNFLAKYENVKIRRGLASFASSHYNKIPKSTHTLLLKDKDKEVRYYLIGNNTQPKSLINELLKDPSWEIRKKTIEYNKLSSEQLDKLANDEHWKIRESVAKSSYTTAKTLKKLAKDENKEVKMQVAARPVLPLDIIKILVKDGNMRVLDVLTDNQYHLPDNVILDIFKCNSYWANAHLIDNNKFSEKVFLWLFNNSEVIDMGIREWNKLIRNHKMPKYLHISFLCLEQCRGALGFTKRKLMHNVSISDLEKIYNLLRENLKNLNYESVDVIFSEMRDKPISKKALNLIIIFKRIILKAL